jgi:hypothetical protein
MVGELFSSMGLEGVGETFSEIGKWVSFLGTALMTIIPIIKFVGTTFKIEGGKIVATGIAA